MIKQKNERKLHSVVYSFAGRWHLPLSAGEVQVFFRKRRPVSTPSRVFFYVGVPVKKIIGFAEIERIESVDIKAALAVRSNGAISEKELVSYIGEDGIVSAIWISTPNLLPEPLDLIGLRQHCNFNPPQSFCNVSDDLHEYLMENKK